MKTNETADRPDSGRPLLQRPITWCTAPTDGGDRVQRFAWAAADLEMHQDHLRLRTQGSELQVAYSDIVRVDRMPLYRVAVIRRDESDGARLFLRGISLFAAIAAARRRYQLAFQMRSWDLDDTHERG